MAEFRCHWVRTLIQWGLLWLASFIFVSALWIRQKFGVPTFNQFLFHVLLGIHGQLNAEYYVLKSFVVTCVILPGFATFALSSGAFTAALPDVLGIDRLLKKSSFLASAACLFLACAFLLHQVSYFKFAKSQVGPDYFSAHFKDPRQVKLVGKNPRNLVLIYVESLEASYSNTHLFGKNLLKSLDPRTTGGVSFARYNQMPGTGFTMGAIVSTQCGVPLEAITIYERNVQGQKLKHILPGAVCLGDVLDEFGYRNIFMGGASLDFSGKGQFFKDHHYQERYGRREWIAQGESPQNMSAWGLQDDDLFRHAKTELDTLEASGGRFNLTLLTLDTHFQGIDAESKYCVQRGFRDFEGTVECTADQVADFLDYIRQKGYLKNIDVVVLGDHLAMNNPTIDRLKEASERTIFNLFISNKAPQKIRDDIVHFDLFPTILDFIGIHVEKSQLALGYSGFSPSDRLPSADRLVEMRNNLMHPSPIYFALWNLPEAVPGT